MSDDPFITQSSQVLENGNSRPLDLPPTIRRKGFWQSPRDSKSLDQNLGELMEYGDSDKGEGRKKRAKPVDHNARTRELIELFGYAATKEETWRTFPSGFSCKVDKFGLWDWSAIKPGKPVLYVQVVTGDNGLKVHLRAMTSDKKALDNRKAKIDNLRWCLSQGYNCVIVVWSKQPNGRWKGDEPKSPRIVKITSALVDEVVGRKRK